MVAIWIYEYIELCTISIAMEITKVFGKDVTKRRHVNVKRQQAKDQSLMYTKLNFSEFWNMDETMKLWKVYFITAQPSKGDKYLQSNGWILFQVGAALFVLDQNYDAGVLSKLILKKGSVPIIQLYNLITLLT